MLVAHAPRSARAGVDLQLQRGLRYVERGDRFHVRGTNATGGGVCPASALQLGREHTQPQAVRALRKIPGACVMMYVSENLRADVRL